MERPFDGKLAEVLKHYSNNSGQMTLRRKFKDNVSLVSVDGTNRVIKEYSTTVSSERLEFFEGLQNFTNARLGIQPYVIGTVENKLHVNLGTASFDLTNFVKNERVKGREVGDVEKFFFDIGFFVGKLHSIFSEFEGQNPSILDSELKINMDGRDDMNALFESYQTSGVDESWSALLKEKIKMMDAYYPVVSIFRDLPRRIVHGDLYPKNILLDKKHRIVGLIDFAQSGKFFRCYEVMRAIIQTNRMFGLTDLEPKYVKSFLKGYLVNNTLETSELENMLDLYIFAQSADLYFLDAKTLTSNDVDAKNYAKFRFDSLSSLHKNRMSINRAIKELVKAKRT